MDEQQLRNYQTTLKILGDDGDRQLLVPKQTDGKEIWAYGLQDASQQTMHASWQRYVLCVGKAAAKSAEKKRRAKKHYEIFDQAIGTNINQVNFRRKNARTDRGTEGSEKGQRQGSGKNKRSGYS